YQNHPQPRYFTVIAFFSFFLVAMGVQALLHVMPASALSGEKAGDIQNRAAPGNGPGSGAKLRGARAAIPGIALLGAAVFAACVNAEWTLNFAMHPEYTLVSAAQRLTRYIDQHPNGKRLLLSISGDEITMITDLPTICDDFGTQDLVSKLK